MKVLITGGSGLVGRRLAVRLVEKGHDAFVLTRDPERARGSLDPRVRLIAGDPVSPGPWQEAVAQHDAVVHLAGENLFAKRWNDAFRARIRDSRTLGTTHVARAVAAAAKKPVLVSASAVGIYGPRDDQPIDESAPPGADFLAGVCHEWERATAPAEEAGARVAIARIGVVLDPAGGALAQMLPPFKAFVGGPAGSGKQWVSWIHVLDLIELLVFAVESEALRGPVNATAPEPVTMAELSKAIGAALGRPSWLPVPGFALKLALGEVANVILTGQKVLPKKALAAGFTFRWPTAGPALQNLLAPEFATA